VRIGLFSPSPAFATATISGARMQTSGTKANVERTAAIHALVFMGRTLHPLAARGSSPMTHYVVPIGVAAKRSGVKVPTIRYYEQIGLLPKPLRTKNNRGNYDAADLRRLIFIRHARELESLTERILV
jgi:hypothetical protein